MDAGSLAQMSSLKNLAASSGLSVPGSGFSSRRGSNIKSLSFDQHNSLASQDKSAPTPRTSRSHLLAGLRTAPKCSTPTTIPLTAPPSQLQHKIQNEVEHYSGNSCYMGGPKTSNVLAQGDYVQVNKGQMYAAPEQILAPPEINVDEFGHEALDPNYYAQLVATNMYLADQQQRLQHQLMSVQAAAQQFQGMSLGMQQYTTPPVTPRNLYQQQVKNNTMGMPGLQLPLYPYYNTITGQQAYLPMDQQTYSNELLLQKGHLGTYSPTQRLAVPSRARSTQQQQQQIPESTGYSRSISPPGKSQSPGLDHIPLPPPSAGAFRRGHRKAPSSLAFGSEDAGSLDAPRSAYLAKTAGLSSACLSGFGPGQGRVGEHPLRQPRGPPSLDELLAKPTTKYEGSKNFATRTRRSAVSNLVRAGIERRRAPGSAGSGSASSISEIGEVTLSVTDNDSDSGRSGSGSLMSRPALGSPRTSIHGAIGSNRPSSRQNNRSMERKSVASLDSSYTSASVSGDEANAIGGNFAAVFKHGNQKMETEEMKKKAPMLILTPAEKRKTYF